ncbi:hypothetical protein [Meiothermus ruber]|uniref:hypothetical protein n=1 Tax=Meiothermus ruber TaxID=277 RepID=UPI00034DC960|nr:hypothetical protein [Meiothermus ruber]GAO74262.1 chaperone DnaJ domain-containing protein [Meiothermus ruber H328]
MREEICPECGGDGYLVYVGGPGYYSSAFGNYLPSEECVRCSFCGGSGLVEVEDAAVQGTEADRVVVPGEGPGPRAA